jgi:CubicO group peptidase (beta-lactamase class C family)
VSENIRYTPRAPAMLLSAQMKFLPHRPRLIGFNAFFCLLGLLLFANQAAGQRDKFPGHEDSPVLRKVISDAAIKYKIPGIAAALIEHGQIKAIETFGFRDQKSASPITSHTIFEAGSLGEPVYAYSVLLLSAEGRFNSGAPIPTFFPLPYVRDLDATSPNSRSEQLYDPQFNQISAMRVMNHTSGMPDWARGQHLRLQTAPGKKWSYSSEGYIYLQRAVESATSESLDSLVTRSILGAARMSQSSFSWKEAYTSEIATGYDSSGTPMEAPRYARPIASASLYTTIRDYAQFIAYVMASSPAQRAHESAVSLMLNPTVTVDDSVPFSWGLGFGLEKIGDDLFFFHRDKSLGMQSFVIASRKSGNGIVIFTNSGNGLEAVGDILAATSATSHPVIRSDFLRPRQ